MNTNNNKEIEEKCICNHAHPTTDCYPKTRCACRVHGDFTPSPLTMEETTVVLKHFKIGNATAVITFKGEKMLIGIDAPGQEEKIEINLKPIVSSAVTQALEEERGAILKKIAEYEYHKDLVHCTCLGALKDWILSNNK